MKILFVSLGCDKNLVDSETMLGILGGRGYTFTDDETEADVIVVNTCCFINDAKEESRPVQGADRGRMSCPAVQGGDHPGDRRGGCGAGNRFL